MFIAPTSSRSFSRGSREKHFRPSRSGEGIQIDDDTDDDDDDNDDRDD